MVNVKPKTPNYFKNVTEFGKNIFKSELNNTGATYNMFDFVMNNLMVLILLMIIIGVILWGVSFFRNKNKIKKLKTVEDSFSHAKLDNNETTVVECNKMEIPKQLSKYTYAFNLNIKDFYCNKGIWKCLMLKGIDVTKYTPEKCENFGHEDDSRRINKDISPEACFKYVCKQEYDELNRTTHSPKDLEMRVDADDLSKRVDLICRATKMGDEGKNLLACGMSKCNLMTQRNAESELPSSKGMLRGHANSFISSHNEYCTKVYTDKVAVSNDSKQVYADQIDNKCSNKILIEKYPHLIPRDLTGFLNSKALDKTNLEKYDDNAVDKTVNSCWNKVIETLPIQAPGIWLHPYVNNIRIVLTTYSSKPYDKDNFNFSHSHDSTSFTDRKYDIKKINRDATGTEHPNVIRYSAPSPCEVVADKKSMNNENVYREFFDIDNFPIKEIFHFALVINGHSAEVYLNAKLIKTQVLFGEARYNKGDLYLNYGGSLNGSMMDFKFISHALNQKNILNLLREKPMIQDSDSSGLKVNREHRHDIEFNHTHKFDDTMESDHLHSVQEEDINKDYYSDD